MATPSNKRRAWLGWCLYDWANSAFATVVLAAVLPVYFASLVPHAGARVPLPWGARVMPATALWGYAVSLSALIVALAAPSLGALADRRGVRRRLLITFCLLGSAATVLLGFTRSGDYLLVAALFVIANIGFAAGNIFYNAFLPTLASGPDLDRLSARGYALGYIGGGLVLLVVFLLVRFSIPLGFSSSAAATRAGFLLTGVWWVGFALPTFAWVREERSAQQVILATGGQRNYLKIFAEVLRYRDLALFLLAFVFYNDGIQTVIAVSAIFGREELGLSQVTILGTFLMIQFVAMPGSLLFGHLASRWGAKRSVMLSLLLFIGVTIFAFRMQQGWEFWVLGLVVALILGGSQAISRSLFAALIPPGKNAEFFGFYAISGKFAAILGPLVFATIADFTGSTRLAILALCAFFLLGLLLLAGVDMQRGRQLAAIGH